MTEEEKKYRDDLEDRFLLVQVLSLVRDYLQDKREKQQIAEQTSRAKPKTESIKEKSSEV
ncbi:MAG TPA: hypothetical protein VK709_19025 [Candidatus Saccharimonadales bacterium]|nr:hypothetical protein [Candidatus Saccharimonadales bacterium]